MATFSSMSAWNNGRALNSESGGPGFNPEEENSK